MNGGFTLWMELEFHTIFTPSTISRLFSLRTAITFPCCPAWGPWVTWTKSPRTMFHFSVSHVGFFFWIGFIRYFPRVRPHCDRRKVEFMLFYYKLKGKLLAIIPQLLDWDFLHKSILFYNNISNSFRLTTTNAHPPLHGQNTILYSMYNRGAAVFSFGASYTVYIWYQ